MSGDQLAIGFSINHEILLNYVLPRKNAVLYQCSAYNSNESALVFGWIVVVI